MDSIRQRFLTDRVMTATPAQRVAMLYDRLTLDLARARTDAAGAGEHLEHAALIVAELLGSLNLEAGGPAENLQRIYEYTLGAILTAQLSGDTTPLTSIEANIWTLREAWSTVAAGTVTDPAAAARHDLVGASWTA